MKYRKTLGIMAIAYGYIPYTWLGALQRFVDQQRKVLVD